LIASTFVAAHRFFGSRQTKICERSEQTGFGNSPSSDQLRPWFRPEVAFSCGVLGSVSGTCLSALALSDGVGQSEETMLGTILIIVLILLLIGALPTWPYSNGWGYYPGGGLGLILIIVIVLVLVGRI
jgi:hypothetical protein